MGFSISTNFRISNYTDAKLKYETTTPIRGKKSYEDIRPIGDRRAQHIRIIKNDDDSYSCRLYYTDVARFYPDGRIEYRIEGWTTTSTANFLRMCLPRDHWAYRLHNHIQVHCYATKHYYTVMDGFTIDTKSCPFTYSGYRPPTKEVVNREESKKKRAKFDSFLKFAKGFMVTLNMTVPKPDYNTQYEVFKFADDYIRGRIEVSEDDYLKVLSGLGYSSNWRQQYYDFSKVKKQVYDANTVYDEIYLPMGTMQK